MENMQAVGFAVTFAIGVLAGLGVGSGGLLIIYLTSFLSVSQLDAQAINLVFFVFSAGASLLWHYTHRKTDAKALALITAGGGVGAYIGSYLAKMTDPSLLSSLFGVMLIISGIVTLASTAKARKKRKNKI